MITLILSLILNLQAKVAFPDAVLTPSQMMESFRGGLRVKVLDLEKNYYPVFSDNMIIYRSHEGVSCQGKNQPAGSNLARIQFVTKRSEKRIDQTIQYYGCDEKLILSEFHFAEGDQPSEITFNQVRAGQTLIDLGENEKTRSYRLRYGQGTDLFQYIQNRTNDGEFHEARIAGQLAFQSTYVYTKDSSRLTHKYFPYSIVVDIGQSQWSTTMGFTPYTNIVESFKTPKDYVTYFDSTFSQVSRGTFVFNFNYNIGERTLNRVQSFVQASLNEFPPTSVISTGVQNQRLLEELRLNYTRLLNNTETNLVRQYIQELIDSAEKGQLQDNRPKGGP